MFKEADRKATEVELEKLNGGTSIDDINIENKINENSTIKIPESETGTIY